MPTNEWAELYRQMPTWQVFLLGFTNWTMLGIDVPTLFHFSPEHGFQFFHHSGAGTAPDGAKWAGEFLAVIPAWSIGVEIWFYLLAPFLVRLREGWLVLISIGGFALKAWMTMRQYPANFFFPTQIDFFIVGMLLHRFYVRRKPSTRGGYVMLILVVGLFLCFNKLPSVVVPYLVYATAIPAIPFLFALTRSNSFDLSLGNLSYSMYLVHMPIMGALWLAFRTNGGLATSTATVLASVALYLVVERPIERLRNRLASGNPISFAHQRPLTAVPDDIVTFPLAGVTPFMVQIAAAPLSSKLNPPAAAAHHSGKTINSLARSNKSRAGKHATNGVDAAAVFSPVCSGGIQRGARLPSRTPPISKKKNHCSKQTKNPGQLALGYFSMHRLGVSPCRRRSHELNNSSLRRPTK
jgi:peptidoglycan/LPS O-acetylase OafA/YrhL